MCLVENYRIMEQQKIHEKNLKNARMKAKSGKKIKVAFFATHSSVWKYDGLVELLNNDNRFDVVIIICPIINYGYENMLLEADKTYRLMIKKKTRVITAYSKETNKYLDVKKVISPDVIFFTNPHKGLVHKDYFISNYSRALTCYVQYSFHITHLNKYQYDQLFHNLLWKAYYETEIHLNLAKENARNKGCNVVVTGYPGIDSVEYKCRVENNVWKNKDRQLKRIIWAPHHSIDNREDLNYSCFLNYSDFMLELAYKYKDYIQVAFKPHPLLQNKLYQYDGWGKVKTDKYYESWSTGNNTQYESDDYIDLFNSSDAMIFDSASFMAEYLYTGKPALFTCFYDNEIEERFNIFGKLVFKNHYHAYHKNEIENFIKDVVIEGKDIMRKEREVFFNSFLLKNNGDKASKNIYNDILNELQLK